MRLVDGAPSIRLPLLLAVAALTAAAHGARADEPPRIPDLPIEPSETIDIWPGDPPGEAGDPGAPGAPEIILPDRPRPFDQITNVSVPTLSVFLPEPDKRTGAAVLICPGGGLQRLAIEHEGYEVARWLTDHGIAAFLLKYRVPPRDRRQRWLAGLQDAQRAMSIIRDRASDWEVDPAAVGTIGFSAGAEINILLSLYDEERQYDPADDADGHATRPDFTIAVYPGGLRRFRSEQVREQITDRITDEAPPMFFVHAFDDDSLNSILMVHELKKAGVPAELHLFQAGGHGFGVRDSGLPAGGWTDLSLRWLDWQGFLDPPAVRDYARRFIEARDADADRLPRFTAGHAGATLADAYAVQNRLVRHAVGGGERIVGFKAAFATEAAQSAFGLDHPVPGALFESGRLDAEDEPVIPLREGRPILVETEIGYIMATDIGSKVLNPRHAMGAVEAVVPVIELPADYGSRMEGQAEAVDIAATNGGSNLIIVGEPADPASVDPDALAVSLQRDGEVLHEATGADAAGGQAHNLMRIINQIVEQGHTIRRGTLIVSGALGAAHPAEAGRYTADFGELGTIEFELR